MTVLGPNIGARVATVTRWALADLRHDGPISAMSILLLFLLIGPPLFLAVIRAEVVEGWAAALQADPRNREITIIGEIPLTDEQVRQLSVMDLVGFVVPESSTFVSSIRLQGAGRPAVLDMRTSGPGDPILGATPPPLGVDDVTLTAAAAEMLQVGVGDPVALTLRRQPRDRGRETLTVALSVVGIVPATVWPGEIALMHPDRAAGAALWLSPQSDRADALSRTGEDRWRSVRIYAAQVRDAPDLAKVLRARGLETRIASEQITLLVTLSDGLRRLMTLTVAGGLCGLGVAVWLLQVLAVARRRREIALMSAAGLDRLALVAFFVVQGLMLSGVALVFAGVALVPMRQFASTFAAQFTLNTQGAVGMSLPTLAGCAAGVLGLTMIAGTLAASRIRKLDLSTDLRAD